MFNQFAQIPELSETAQYPISPEQTHFNVPFSPVQTSTFSASNAQIAQPSPINYAIHPELQAQMAQAPATSPSATAKSSSAKRPRSAASKKPRSKQGSIDKTPKVDTLKSESPKGTDSITPVSPTQDNLDEDEQVSVEEDKRRRNTAASARFRVRKKQREQVMEKVAKEMTEKCTVLEDRIKELEKENALLKGLLTEKAGIGEKRGEKQDAKNEHEL